MFDHPILPTSLKNYVLAEIKQYTSEVRRELQSINVGVRGDCEVDTEVEECGVEGRGFGGGVGGVFASPWWKQIMVGVEACEMRNLFCCARQESRGLRYTEDFPYLEESKRRQTVIFPTSLPAAKATWRSQQVQKHVHC